MIRLGGDWIDENAGGTTPVSVDEPEWFVMPSGRILMVAPAHWGLAKGVSILSNMDKGWNAAHLQLSQWGGC
jgi:hypothetical protein